MHHFPSMWNRSSGFPFVCSLTTVSMAVVKSDGSTTVRRPFGSIAICAERLPTAAIHPSTVAASAFHLARQSGFCSAWEIEGMRRARILAHYGSVHVQRVDTLAERHQEQSHDVLDIVPRASLGSWSLCHRVLPV